MDQADWANGLNVFYIHADAVSADEKSGNKGYMDSTSMTLEAGKSKTYAFEFTGVADEKEMKDTLYEEGIMDAVAVPGMKMCIRDSLCIPCGCSKRQIYLHGRPLVQSGFRRGFK